ncbi:MAG: hypothetical protein ACFB51_06925 [Anaerolineae bacterium]
MYIFPTPDAAPTLIAYPAPLFDRYVTFVQPPVTFAGDVVTVEAFDDTVFRVDLAEETVDTTDTMLPPPELPDVENLIAATDTTQLLVRPGEERESIVDLVIADASGNPITQAEAALCLHRLSGAAGALSPDGSVVYLASVGSTEGVIVAFDGQTGEQTGVIRGFRLSPVAYAFAPDTVYTADTVASLVCGVESPASGGFAYTLPAGDLVTAYPAEGLSVSALAAGPDGLFALAGLDAVLVWRGTELTGSAANDDFGFVLDGAFRGEQFVGVTVGSDQVVAVDPTGEVTILLEEVSSLFPGDTFALVDESRALVQLFDEIGLADLESGAVVDTITGADFARIAYNPARGIMAVRQGLPSDPEGEIVFFSVGESGFEELNRVTFETRVYQYVTFTPDGSLLLLSQSILADTVGPLTLVVDVDAGRLIEGFDLTIAGPVAISPDGRFLITPGGPGNHLVYGVPSE